MANETPRRIVGPVGGAANNSAFIDQPLTFAPIGTIENVQVIAPGSKRPRFGRRPALVKKFSTQLAGGLPVQTGVSLARASGTASYERSNCAAATSYINEPLTTLAGMCWLLEPNTAMFRRIRDLGTQTTGDRVVGAFVVAWHPTLDRVHVGYLCRKGLAITSYGPDVAGITPVNTASAHGLSVADSVTITVSTGGTDITGTYSVVAVPTATRFTITKVCGVAGTGGAVITPTAPHYMTISCYDSLGNRIWQTFLDDRNTPAGSPGTLSIIANEIHVGSLYTYIPAGPYVYVLDTAAGTFHTRYDAGGGWFDEAMQVLEADVSGGTGKLWVLGMGSATTNAVVTTAANVQGWFFRSGVSRFSVTASPTGFTRNALTVELEAGVQHGTYRLSSLLGRTPRGAIPFAFAKLSGGDFVIGFTNRGWNADGTLPPSSIVPQTTIARLTLGSGNGTLVWERDTESLLESHTVSAGPTPGTYYSDIPPGIPGNHDTMTSYGVGGPEPSINAIAVDANDNIYCGGRRNNATTTLGENLFSFTSDGDLRWATRISGMIHQHCIKVDPTDGHIWVGGFRNDDWDGSGGTIYAHLWKVNSSTGAVLLSQDLNEADTHCYGLSISSSGRVAYVTDTI